MALNISKQENKEASEKAALWDTFCILHEPQFQWLLPLFWNVKKNRVSDLGLGISMNLKYFKKYSSSNESSFKNWKVISEIFGTSSESGGHPKSEEMLLILLGLLNGESYESVLENAKEIEFSSLLETKRSLTKQDRSRAIERARQMMRRAKSLLEERNISVTRTGPSLKRFDKLIKSLSKF